MTCFVVFCSRPIFYSVFSVLNKQKQVALWSLFLRNANAVMHPCCLTVQKKFLVLNNGTSLNANFK